MAARGTIGIRKSQFITAYAGSNFVDEHYEVLKELGQGAFGKVSLVSERGTRRERVCKVVDTNGMPPHVLDVLKIEIGLLRTLDHPYIVKLFEYAEDLPRNQIILILEYISSGDCDGLLKDSGGVIEESLSARLIHQLLVAVAYCHSRGVVHRDIKPENMMLMKSNPWARPDCKLIDFGVADSGRMETMDATVGTPAYMAPEVLAAQDGNVYDYKADIWAAGATALEFVCGTPPFGKPEDDRYSNSTQPEAFWSRLRSYRSLDDCDDILCSTDWHELSDECRDFIQLLLSKSPADRPDATEAKEDAWVDLHRPSYQQISHEMVRSMVAYAEAAHVYRCMAFVLATRADYEDTRVHSPAFLAVDEACSGTLSIDELRDGCEAAARFGCDAEVDADDLFEAMNLSNTEFVTYTEFIAASLYGKYHARDGSHDQLVSDAFDSIDTDRDGLISHKDINASFNTRSKEVIAKYLPEEGAEFINVDEWREIMAMASGDQIKTRMSTRGLSRGERGWFSCLSCRKADKEVEVEDIDNSEPSEV